MKYFGGDVSTWVANALVALLPLPTLVPTQERGIQTEWEIGRSLEGNNICSDPKSRDRTTGFRLPPQGKKKTKQKTLNLAYLLGQFFSNPRTWEVGKTTWECRSLLTACTGLLIFNLQTKAVSV